MNVKTDCQICGKECNHLGSHIFHKHKTTARQYKINFGLPIHLALTTEEISDKHRLGVLNSPTFETNFKGSKVYQFKRGNKQNENRYRSPYEMEKIKARIIKFNDQEPEKCPVCHVIKQNMKKHLLLKHGLIFSK